MSTVLEDIKALVEIDAEEDIYDLTLFGHINTGIAFLASNAIPVAPIERDATADDLIGDGKLAINDYELVKSWLYFYCLQRFDASTMAANRFTSTYSNWIENEMTVLLGSLKARYDV